MLLGLDLDCPHCTERFYQCYPCWRGHVYCSEACRAALLAAILARLEMVPLPAGGVPVWLVEAIGNPLSYDAAAPHRKDVCVRVDPKLYRRLQAMKERLRLRTTAGALEYVLRAGLVVAERGAGSY